MQRVAQVVAPRRDQLRVGHCSDRVVPRELPLEAGDADKAKHLMLHHIDHIEADLDLRNTDGLALKDALSL